MSVGSEPLIMGYMNKRGDGMLSKGWKKRYFVLQESGTMEYFVGDDMKDKKGAFDCNGAEVIPDDGRDIGIKPIGAKRIYLLQAPDKETKEEWMRNLQSLRKVRSHTITEVNKEKKKLRSGFLNKKGDKGLAKTWRLRWFAVFDDGMMNYYETEKMKTQKGGFPVINCSIITDEAAALHFGVQPEGATRIYVLQCDSEKEYNEWVGTIEKLGGKQKVGKLASFTQRLTSMATNKQLLGKKVDIVGKTATYSGFLDKKGDKGVIKEWKSRFFALYDMDMVYFTDEKMLKRKGSFPVGGAVLSVTDGSEDGAELGLMICIKPYDADRIYALKAGDDTSKEEWIEVLEKAGATLEMKPLIKEFPWLDVKPVVANEDDLVCCGWLSKKGEKGLRNWKRRYFGLYWDKNTDAYTISYFTSEGREPNTRKGGYNLHKCRVIVQDAPETLLMFGVQPFGSDRIYVLEADTEDDKRNWVREHIKDEGTKVKADRNAPLLAIDEDGGILDFLEEEPEDELPEGWRRLHMGDQEYYYHEESGVSSWVLPTGAPGEEDDEEKTETADAVAYNPQNMR